MPSAIFDLFRDAIAQKRQVICHYAGHYREVCPHTLGYSKDGKEQALTFQFAGQTSKGPLRIGEWRCFELSKVDDAASKPGPWYTAPNHSRPQTCVSDVVSEVVF